MNQGPTKRARGIATWRLCVAGICLILTTAVALSLRSAQHHAKLLTLEGEFSQLEAALRVYYHDHQEFPPTDSNHSWRVLLLPYLEFGGFSQQYQFEESWDSENNIELALEMGEAPRYYRSVNSEQQSSMFADFFAGDLSQEQRYLASGIQIHHVTENDDSFLLIEIPNSNTHWLAPGYKKLEK